MSTKPAHLKANDRVAVVATARRVTPLDLKKGIKILEDWGLEVVPGPHLYDREGYLAGGDDQRLLDLQTMMDDPSIKAIFCARGGYGTSRIIDQLDFEKFLRHPKWIIGFSDVTALHLRLQQLKIQSIHGIMPLLFDYIGAESSVQSLKTALFKMPQSITASIDDLNRQGIAEGLITGGNLALICDSLGTSTEIDTNRRILFIEEIDEYLYKVDRMLVHLKRASKLQHLAGLVVGQFSALKDTNLSFGQSFKEIIAAHTAPFSFPVGFNFPLGHESENMPVIYSAKVRLEVGENGSGLFF